MYFQVMICMISESLKEPTHVLSDDDWSMASLPICAVASSPVQILTYLEADNIGL